MTVFHLLCGYIFDIDIYDIPRRRAAFPVPPQPFPARCGCGKKELAVSLFRVFLSSWRKPRGLAVPRNRLWSACRNGVCCVLKSDWYFVCFFSFCDLPKLGGTFRYRAEGYPICVFGICRAKLVLVGVGNLGLGIFCCCVVSCAFDKPS